MDKKNIIFFFTILASLFFLPGVSAYGELVKPVSVFDHNDLTNIQGGSTGQYYHLNQSVYNEVLTNYQAWLNSSEANSLYCQLSGCDFGGDINLGGSNINMEEGDINNVNQIFVGFGDVLEINAGEYYFSTEFVNPAFKFNNPTGYYSFGVGEDIYTEEEWVRIAAYGINGTGRNLTNFDYGFFKIDSSYIQNPPWGNLSAMNTWTQIQKFQAGINVTNQNITDVGCIIFSTGGDACSGSP